jgi:hypothetical protein
MLQTTQVHACIGQRHADLGIAARINDGIVGVRVVSPRQVEQPLRGIHAYNFRRRVARPAALRHLTTREIADGTVANTTYRLDHRQHGRHQA